ncbi:hypothetical protein [[Phormidium] sp. ETS-05]|nr:hypothetical protein [[Phormidium] sp. ETS-05]
MPNFQKTSAPNRACSGLKGTTVIDNSLSNKYVNLKKRYSASNSRVGSA